MTACHDEEHDVFMVWMMKTTMWILSRIKRMVVMSKIMCTMNNIRIA